GAPRRAQAGAGGAGEHGPRVREARRAENGDRGVHGTGARRSGAHRHRAGRPQRACARPRSERRHREPSRAPLAQVRLMTLAIAPLADADVETLCALACEVWRAHYPPIIGTAQTEYMLAERYVPALIR